MDASQSLSEVPVGLPFGGWRWAAIGAVMVALAAAGLAMTQPVLAGWAGYALLLGGNDEQKLVFHYGTGANGKSAFLEALGRMAGSYRAVVSPDTLTGDSQRDGSKANSDIARLHSARLVTVEELPRGVQLKEGLIKSLTGGTRQVARFLQKEIFEFDPVFTAVMSGNDMPSGSRGSMHRRTGKLYCTQCSKTASVAAT